MKTTAVVRAARALDERAAAHARGDRDAALRATATVALWWTVAEEHGATPGDVNAHRTGGAR
ncbi:hypothetical protein Q5762_13960 [Streptomyces sp. P9(2023)]|uniref:hypothetical protein n=1 Tax=Streptomyces sp. P9(2023) TaxID=3064394 RepID=UPI0028F3FA9C|nr:hypothetical protein [Streptomyces sp. P9(2023)]MDT9689422.1 hypothetical protein [Streptomyces sp. P9(2023)]